MPQNMTTELLNLKNRQRAKDANWVKPETMTEILLQQELKNIHRAIDNFFDNWISPQSTE